MLRYILFLNKIYSSFFPSLISDRQVDITARDAGFQKTADDVKVTEETVEHNFKIFRPYLEQNIKPLDLIVYYDYFSIGRCL